MRKTILFSFIVAILFSFAQSTNGQQFNKKIIGYYTSWSIYVRDYHVPDIPADKINYINYAFANIDNATGTIKLGDYYADVDKWYPGDSWEPGALRGCFHQLQILKANNPHLKTFISVGGWTWSTYFSNIALTQESREIFAASCVDFIQEYEFDGVDLDWEYPVSGGLGSNVYRPEDKQNFTLLLAELRSQLDQAGDYLLTIAAPSSPLIQENIEIDQIHQYLDWINIMTYDFHGPWSGESDPVTNFNTPLYMMLDDPTPEPYYSSFNLSAAVEGYLGHGVPMEKLHASLAFYGRGFGGVPNVNNGLFATYTAPASPGTWENGVFDYWDLAQNYIDLNGYVSYWNDEAKVPWLYNPNTQNMISYDNPQSMVAKVNYIKSMNLGGVMFWEFSGDKYATLLNTVYETVNEPTQNTQQISLSQGYSFVSSRIIPENPDMMLVLNDVLNENLDFVRNSNGQVLRKIGPNWVNGIGDWITTEGYLFRMNAADEINFQGEIIDPLSEINLSEGYQFVSYLPEISANALFAFENILNENLDYIRNSSGGMLRKIGPNWVNGIGNCNPGEGYLIKMFADDELVYNIPLETTKSSVQKKVIKHFTFKGGNAADPVYTIYVSGLKIGDEVAVFDGYKMVGASMINSEKVFDNSIPVFSTLSNGKGFEAGNAIQIKVFDCETKIEVPFSFEMENPYGNAFPKDYFPAEDGEFSILKVTKNNSGLKEFSDNINIYPNPANDILNIISDELINKIEIINSSGQIVNIINSNSKQINYNIQQTQSGVYFIKIHTRNNTIIKKITIQ